MTIGSDFRRCGHSLVGRLKGWLLNPAMWAVTGYRIRRWAGTVPPRPIRWLLAPLTLSLGVATQVLSQVQLSPGAVIGPGLYLPHSGTIVVGSGSELGANCTVAHNVTLGHAGGTGKRGGPQVGDRVYVGPGAILIGDISVGDDALIGAGAVVVKSVPARGVVAGNPARLLSHGGAFELVDYPGMDIDPARLASLAAREMS